MIKVNLAAALLLLQVTVFNQVAKSQVCNPLPASCDISHSYYPLPKMFVDKDTGLLRIREFAKNKLFKGSKQKKMRKLYGFQDISNTYPWAAFKKMIDSLDNVDSNYYELRIFFARYDGTKIPPKFPEIKKNKLILLFSPHRAEEDYNCYYFINDDDTTLYSVPIASARQWINVFEDQDMKALVKTIQRSDSDNYSTGHPQQASDTKSIRYYKNNIDSAFLVERYYQDSAHGVTISAIKMHFSAYTKKGRVPTIDNMHVYRRRLFVQFDYMKRNSNGENEIFYLDDDFDYCCRAANSKSNILLETGKRSHGKGAKVQVYAVDNGQLCPTVCN